MTRDEFKRELLTTARSRARQGGYGITDEALREIELFINRGVDRISNDDFEKDIYKNIARSGLTKLIDEMSNYTKTRTTLVYLTSTSFSESRSRICPMWPFC